MKRLEDVGEWKCFACGGINGVKDEGTRMVEEIMGKERAEGVEESERGEEGSETGRGSEGRSKDESEETEVEVQIKAGLKEEEGDKTDESGHSIL